MNCFNSIRRDFIPISRWVTFLLFVQIFCGLPNREGGAVLITRKERVEVGSQISPCIRVQHLRRGPEERRDRRSHEDVVIRAGRSVQVLERVPDGEPAAAMIGCDLGVEVARTAHRCIVRQREGTSPGNPTVRGACHQDIFHL